MCKQDEPPHDPTPEDEEETEREAREMFLKPIVKDPVRDLTRAAPRRTKE